MSPSNPSDRRESQPLRPTTKVLTQGFDPTLSVGSASPAGGRAARRAWSIRASIIPTRKFSRTRS